MRFSDSEIRSQAFPAVIEEARRVYEHGRVRDIHLINDIVVASVSGQASHRTAIQRLTEEDVTFSCTCGFTWGGACEHVVATMLAVNARDGVQTGLDFGDSSASPTNISVAASVESLPPPNAPEVTALAEKPILRLYISEAEGMIAIELRFFYAGLVEFKRGEQSVDKVVSTPESGYVRILRSRMREDAAVARLFEAGLEGYGAGRFTPAGDARAWIVSELPLLAAEGFEVYGRDELSSTRLHEEKPRLGVNVSYRNGAISCDVDVSFSGMHASLAALVSAVQNGSCYVLLSDGSTGVIPASWLDKLAAICSVADPESRDTSLMLRPAQGALVDMLLSMADECGIDETYAQYRKQLENFSGIDEAAPPKNLKANLRPYQLSGIEWFYFLQKHNFGGCLADDMGLGKTIQTLALLLKEKEIRKGPRTSVVVAPASLLFNWQREAQKFAPSLLTMIYHGSDRKRYGPQELRMADFIITSYGTLMRDIDIFLEIPLNYAILDEAHVIKNPVGQGSRTVRQIKARFRLALTGTPIENGLSELWSLFTFLNPGMLGSYASFVKEYAKPVEREGNEAAALALHKLVFPFILRRTKKQVATELPAKIESTLWAEMTPRQRMIYDITRDAFRGQIMQVIDKEGIDRARMRILEGLLRLRQICCHPMLYDPSFEGDSGKFELLDTSIDDLVAGGHKVLIFSQFVKALNLINARLASRKIPCEILTGATPNRAAVVDRFVSSPKIPVFLISLKAGGVGLNLTAADYVVHLDPWWNPAAHMQAADRAYRIGQTRQVFVYSLITKDSIEERVMDLQESKKALYDQVVKPESGVFKSLTRTDVAGLFS